LVPNITFWSAMMKRSGCGMSWPRRSRQLNGTATSRSMGAYPTPLPFAECCA